MSLFVRSGLFAALSASMAIGAGCSDPPAATVPDGSVADVTMTDGTVKTDGPMADATPMQDAAPDPDASGGDSGGGDGGGGSGDWGFRPMTDGFAFENYTNMSMPVNLTPVEMRRIFGPMVCEGAAATGDCTLVPQARQWMEQQNQGMNGGHCEGMAVLASLMYSGHTSPAMFGAMPGTFSINMMGNAALTREVALWFVTQTTVPGLERRDLTPRALVDQLAIDLSRGRAYNGTILGMYLRSGNGGHAITPYLIRRPSATMAEIVSYDNNWPSMERVVTVDLAANTWRYIAATNPTEMGSLYDGDATTFNLTLTDIGRRTTFPHACSFCGNAPMDGGGRGSVNVSLQGEGDLSISDGMGRTVGSDSMGRQVNTLPGAMVTRVRSGNLFQDSPEPEYTVPRAMPLTITLDGSRLSAMTPSEVLVTGPGFSLDVDDINLDPMQMDTITVQPGMPDITYRSSGPETPVLSLAFQQAADDYLIELRSGGMTSGQTLRLAADFPMNRARISFAGSTSPPDFTLYMERVSDRGVIVFQHAGIAATARTVLYINYATWMGDGMPLSVGVDTDGDGTIDRTDMLSDQP